MSEQEKPCKKSRSEINRENARKSPRYRGGISNDPLFVTLRYIERYAAWNGMKVCAEWAHLEDFITGVRADVGDCPSSRHKLWPKIGNAFKPGNIEWVHRDRSFARMLVGNCECPERCQLGCRCERGIARRYELFIA